MNKRQYKAKWMDSRVWINERREVLAKLIRGNRRAGRRVIRAGGCFYIQWQGVEFQVEPRA